MSKHCEQNINKIMYVITLDQSSQPFACQHCKWNVTFNYTHFIINGKMMLMYKI